MYFIVNIIICKYSDRHEWPTDFCTSSYMNELEKFPEHNCYLYTVYNSDVVLLIVFSVGQL